MYFALCALVLGLAYFANIVMVSVGFHRGLAHESVHLHPRFRRFIVATGSWITGIDPKAWVVMHRMHHADSDTPDDPHSPTNVGILGIGMEQLRSYERTLRGLKRNDPAFTRYAYHLDFDLNWLNRTRRWYLPYALHATIGLAIAASGAWLLGLAYFAGMMSHPFQGWMVNSFGHAIGGRNFEVNDNSRNNLLAAWLIFGEGLQNNHHQYPKSAKFSYLKSEPDAGYHVCRAFQALGMLTIDTAHLIPAPGTVSQSAKPLRRAA